MNEISDDLVHSFYMEKIGCMMMCHSKKAFEAEIRVVERSKKFNLNIEILDHDELQKYEPDVELDIYGAVLWFGNIFGNQALKGVAIQDMSGYQ